MVLLIDAYNLLKRLYGPLVSDKQRDHYITMLNAYALKKHHKIILVFDGGFFEYPVREKKGNVVSIYVGKHQTADQAIMDYIAQHAKNEMIVISSDRAVTDYASKHTIVSLDSIVFNDYVKRALEKPMLLIREKIISKLHPDHQNEELDALMMQASQDIPLKPEDQPKHETIFKGLSLSKREKKIMALLKKL